MNNTLKDDFIQITANLEKHHALFYNIWLMGVPQFTDSIPTACINFDDNGQELNFLFNEKFYNSLSNTEKEFIICHEMLHIILNHGHRLKENNQFAQNANIAMDIAINHMLVQKFNFNRNELSINKKLCWTDTVFPDPKNIPTNETAEYYFQLLKEHSSNFNSIDVHDFLFKLTPEQIDKVVSKLNDQLTPEEKESLKDVIEKHYEMSENSPAGASTTGQWSFINTQTIHKKKWETVIKKWAYPFIADFKNQEQWARINRRFTFLDDQLLIPSEMEDENIQEPNKIDVVFFLDTSGSCWHLKERFFKAALSLPPWRFNVQLCCFDTRVYETTLESKQVYGGGGTRFNIMEEYIQNKYMKDNTKYPFVFVITDGYGNHVYPQYPEKWYWFLSNSYQNYIPKTSNIYKLSNFE
jgi:predicted metal-dependent peptidase